MIFFVKEFNKKHCVTQMIILRHKRNDRTLFDFSKPFLRIAPLLLLTLAACNNKPTSISQEERAKADSIVKTVNDIDSFSVMQKRMEAENNHLGNIVTLKEWGKQLRNESRFDEALNRHSEGLKLAEEIKDTIEWVEALNNMGTDYRRMGILDMAQEYHYLAWKISEEHTDTSAMAKKNRVKSLNGLGNIYMTMGNYERADSAFRLALKGERQLGSNVGQAINYANIGSIFEHRGEIDSAWVYYRLSMDMNRQAGSKVGISLCHTYYGSLYEKDHLYADATREYETGYELMKESKDEWHALSTLIALAGIHNTTGDKAKTKNYLEKARKIAENINSKEHLAEIYNIYYEFFKRQGNYQQALDYREKASIMLDSVVNIEKVNRIQNTSLNVERTLQMQRMNEVNMKLKNERTGRYIGFAILAFVILLLSVLIGAMHYIQQIRVRNHRALKQMSNLRENFFTNITHEFRTPLTVILGMSHDIAKNTTLPPSVQQNAMTIERQGKSLLSLINQLLDISKVKSAIGEPDWRSGNIIAHLTMIVDSYREHARSRKIDLQFIATETIEMDFVPDYINKVMNNLISNSLKFTPEYGKVNVSAKRHNNELQVEVTDTGIGIPKESLPFIFDTFYIANNDTQNIGMGIGLALVKQIIDSTGGKITVSSEVDKGTTFSITIPIRHGEKRHAPVNTEESANIPLIPIDKSENEDSITDSSDRRILIVEDNTDVAAFIGSQLKNDYSLFYATDGKQGLERAIEIVPDLIITDLMIPEIDGLELCRQVRQNEIVNHIPIIVVTAKTTEADKIKGLEAGADAYLMKPFNSDELTMRIEKLLEQRQLLSEKYTQTASNDKLNINSRDYVDKIFLNKLNSYVLELIDNNQHIEVNDVASHLCMSYSQLHRKLSALTGYTTLGYIQRIKLRKAQKMLEENMDMSFRSVADKCGFSDYSNFVRAFKNIYGITPKQYVKGVS